MAEKTYLVIEKGEGQIFKGDEENSRYEAGEELTIDETKGDYLVSLGFLTAVRRRRAGGESENG